MCIQEITAIINILFRLMLSLHYFIWLCFSLCKHCELPNIKNYIMTNTWWFAFDCINLVKLELFFQDSFPCLVLGWC